MSPGQCFFQSIELAPDGTWTLDVTYPDGGLLTSSHGSLEQATLDACVRTIEWRKQEQKARNGNEKYE